MTPFLRDRLFRPRGWPRRLALRRATAAVLVLLAAVLAFRGPSSGAAPTVPMLVAARDLAPGVTLGPGDVRVAASPSSLRPAAALTTVAEASGRVLAGATTEGEPLTGARLVGPENSRLATGDPTAVAVPVRLADPAVAGLLAPGARVDVVTVAPAGEAVVLARDATVLTVRPPEARDRSAGRLVVIALPEAAATAVAATALGQPVAVTLH